MLRMPALPDTWAYFAGWRDLPLALLAFLLIILQIIWWRQQTRAWFRIAAGSLLAALLLPGLGCADGSACTEIGCEHEATVTFPAGLVTGAYTLVLEGERDTATARCLDPGNPETADNPVGLSCDGNGFVLEGLELANERGLPVGIDGSYQVQTDLGKLLDTGLVFLEQDN